MTKRVVSQLNVFGLIKHCIEIESHYFLYRLIILYSSAMRDYNEPHTKPRFYLGLKISHYTAILVSYVHSINWRETDFHFKPTLMRNENGINSGYASTQKAEVALGFKNICFFLDYSTSQSP